MPWDDRSCRSLTACFVRFVTMHLIEVLSSGPGQHGGLLRRWLGGGICELVARAMRTIPCAAIYTQLEASWTEGAPIYRSAELGGFVGRYVAHLYSPDVAQYAYWGICEPVAPRPGSDGLNLLATPPEG
jgi:hypothetical protein